ncbi:MAG: helical backbone metal receptor [Burkholderiaceae bacterium]|jgi:iron complex transport system substrate-binding protein|nr:helical backbone metal receptor [Burkholderiaceae bacterium]
MKRIAAIVLALCALAVRAGEVIDDSGHALNLSVSPARVISLLPSLTETVCALDACGRLVGVDRYSNWPQSVRDLPRLGGGLDPSVEAIAALKPDLVLISVSSPAAARLRALGLTVAQLEPRTGADLRRVTVALGQLLHVDGAQALLRDIDTGVQAAARALPASARGARVYFEVGPGPYAAGRGSFIGELMDALGLLNVVDTGLGAFPRLNPEYVVRAAPDVVIAADSSLREMASRPGWANMRALRTGRTCSFEGNERDVLVRPGPRMAEAAHLLARCVTTASQSKAW